MATNEELVQIAKKTQAIASMPGGMTVERYNALSEEDKILFCELTRVQQERYNKAPSNGE